MLYWDDHTTGSFNWRDWSWVEYKRMQELYPKSTLFGDQDYTNDLAQGNIADCYFMSGIYAYSENV